MAEHFGGLLSQTPRGSGPAPGAEAQPDNSAAAALGNASRVMGLIANKNIPPRMKAELWNSVIVPNLGEMMGGGIPAFNEWPEELDEYAKRASGILKEKSLTSEEKVQALKSLMASAEEDIGLAPGIQKFREMQEEQNDFETHQMLQIMMGGQDGSEPSDEDVAAFASIRQRNPQAAVSAAEMIDNMLAGGEE